MLGSLIVLASWISWLFPKNQQAKIEEIKKSEVLLIKTYANSFYGIPLKVNSQFKIQVLLPRLTKEGDVEYIYSWHPLDRVEVPNWDATPLEFSLQTTKQLAPMIKEHLAIAPDIQELKKHYQKISELADLISTSEIYAEHLELYERALAQIETLLIKARELQNLYVTLIREALIGSKLAEYTPDSIQVSIKIAFETQYKNLKEEYQKMKDTANAYYELVQETNSINS